MVGLEENYHRLLDRIGEAVLRSGRQLPDVRLVAVSKRVEAERILEAIELQRRTTMTEDLSVRLSITR